MLINQDQNVAGFSISDLDLELLEDFDSSEFQKLCTGATWMLEFQNDDLQEGTQEHKAIEYSAY